jgi:hypothetical protein
MKKTVGLFLAFICFNTFAQKIDLDREKFPVAYITLPENNALIDLDTYNVHFYSSTITLGELGLKDAALEAAFNMVGYTYTKNAEADFLLEISIDNVKAISQSIEQRHYTSKNAQGVSVQGIAYYVQSNIIAPTTIKLVIKETSAEVEQIRFATISSPMQFKSKEFESSDAASLYINKSLIADRNSFVQKAYQDQFNTVFLNFKKKYCYELTKAQELFWIIDLKKAPEFAEYNDQLYKAKSVFEKMEATASIEPLKLELAPIMKYWADKSAEVDASDKKGRKLKYGYLIALARAQYWMEMFSECEATSDAIIANDYDDGDGKALKAMMKYVKKTFEINKTTTRHFMRPAFNSSEIYKVAGNINTIASAYVITEKAPIGFTVLPGYIIDFEHHRIDGELWVKDLDNEMTFMPEHKTFFVYGTSNGTKKMTITADNIDKLVLGRTANFEGILYKNNVGAPQRIQLFRVLYENDAVRILKLYRTSGIGGNITLTNDIKQIWMGTELCIMKKSDGVIQPVGAISGAKVSENTSKFYAECPALQQKIDAGEFKALNQVDNQKATADYYLSNCR